MTIRVCMFKNSIKGLDKVFKTDIERPKIVLVTGPPGSMKTSFCYDLMAKNLRTTSEFGLYMTLEETAREVGMSVSGVRKRLRALRTTLQEIEAQ